MRLSTAACKCVVTLSLALLGTLVVNPTRADVIVSNLAATFVDNEGPLTASQWEANVFTNTSLMKLTGVSLYLYNTDASPSLYSDAGGQPGVDLTDFTAAPGNASIGGHGIYSFTPNTTVLLQPNTNYWIVGKGLGSTSDSYWDFTQDTTPNIGLDALTQSSGASWTTNFPYSEKFEVDGVVPNVTTPEPGAIALFSGMSLTGLTALVRRRKRK